MVDHILFADLEQVYWSVVILPCSTSFELPSADEHCRCGTRHLPYRVKLGLPERALNQGGAGWQEHQDRVCRNAWPETAGLEPGKASLARNYRNCLACSVTSNARCRRSTPTSTRISANHVVDRQPMPRTTACWHNVKPYRKAARLPGRSNQSSLLRIQPARSRWRPWSDRLQLGQEADTINCDCQRARWLQTL